MLVVTRTISESILIGPDIVITIADIRGRRVRFAIDAPRDVRVERATIPSPPAPLGIAVRLHWAPVSGPFPMPRPPHRRDASGLPRMGPLAH